MINLIPTMTSNTAPSGTATASASTGSNISRAFYAFDGNISTSGDVYYGTNFPKNVYTRYIWQNTVDISNIVFAFVYQSGGSGNWIDIALQVTYDGTTWTNINSQRILYGNTKTIYSFANLNLSNVKGIGLGATDSQSGYGSYFTEIQAYNIVNNNIFLEDNPLVIDDLGSEVSLIANFERAASLRYKVNGVWKYAIPYIKLNGNWYKAIAYRKTNGIWKQGI